MHIFELAELIETKIIVVRVNEESYYTHFIRGELTDGSLLMSAVGRGKSPGGALRDYVRNLRGQRLVIDAFKSTRREFKVPKSLVYQRWPRRKASPFLILR